MPQCCERSDTPHQENPRSVGRMSNAIDVSASESSIESTLQGFMKAGAAVPQAAFGPYKILTLLGQGGGGAVYRAWDPRLEREVALKILHERSDGDPERAQRFMAEARAASALNHPNIVTVFDATFDGATPYVVSELIDGRTLRDEIRNGAVLPKRLLDLSTQIADGLSAAHDAGIVHRDLKPENIMVTRTGRVKIVDFGLADPSGFRLPGEPPERGDLQTRTDFGLRGGTIPYMSPEQARGATTDYRSDQFSFGLILFEMATGRPAFRRDTPAATLDAIINDEPQRVSVLDARMPVMFRWMVERCLAKDAADRYGVTADLHRDLKTLRDRFGELASTQTAQTAPAAWTFWKRGFVATGVIAAFVAGALLRAPLEKDVGAMQFTPLTTDPGYEGFPAWSPDDQTIAYVAEVNDTLQIFTRRISSAGSAQITQAPYDCKYPFWSPDGKSIYYVSLARDRESIWSVGAAGGTPHVVVENASRGAIAPDGGTIAFLRDEQPDDIVGASALWLSTANGGETRYAAFKDLRFVEGALSFSPDGSKIGLSAVPRTIDLRAEARGWQFWIIPFPPGEPYRRLQWWSDVVPRVSSFAWMPDSRHIVVALTSLSTPGSHLWMADLERDQAWSLTRGPGSESYPSSSPDGRRIVFASGEPDYDLMETSLDSGGTRPLLATGRNESDPAWSPEGNLFAYVTDRSGPDEIWLRTRDGHASDRPLILQSDFGDDDRTIMLGSPSFSRDGQRIAYQRNAYKPMWPLRIWISQTAGGPPVPLLPASYEGYQGAPSWSPDGQWVAYTEWRDRQWALAKVRVGSGEGSVLLRTDGVPNAIPSWSPSDDWITWETPHGFVLVSPDGKQQRMLSDDHWLVHTWSKDGSRIFGIRETEQLRLSLVALDARTGNERIVADLGPSPPVNNPVKGLSVSPDGLTVVTSLVHLRGDLWSIADVRWREASPRWFSWFRSR
jgi:Tol biopolymer transport system component